MIKFFGIVLLIIITASLGNYFSLQLKRKTDELKAMIIMVDEISFLIRSKNADVYEIAEKLSLNNKIASELAFITSVKNKFNSCEDSFSKIWKEQVNCYKETALSTDEKNMLLEIGENIGKSDADGQISFLMAEKSELERILCLSKEESAKKAKVYRSLGVLSGAFIALLLI